MIEWEPEGEGRPEWDEGGRREGGAGQEGDPYLGDDGRFGPPWEDPGAGEWLQRLGQTVAAGVRTPEELFRTLRLTGGFWPPLFFYALVMAPSIVVGNALERPFGFITGAADGGWVLGLLALLLFLPVAIPLGLFVSSGITHLMLLIFGWANRPFEATFRVNAYGYGSVAWTFAIPFCGSFIGWIWGVLLEVVGVSQVHGISAGKAAVAVLLPIAVLMGAAACLAAVAGVAVLGALFAA